jgi:hypothetical protein
MAVAPAATTVKRGRLLSTRFPRRPAVHVSSCMWHLHAPCAERLRAMQMPRSLMARVTDATCIQQGPLRPVCTCTCVWAAAGSYGPSHRRSMPTGSRSRRPDVRQPQMSAAVDTSARTLQHPHHQGHTAAGRAACRQARCEAAAPSAPVGPEQLPRCCACPLRRATCP